MQDRSTLFALNRRGLLAGAFLMAGASSAHAAVTPFLTAERVASRAAELKPAAAWVAYETQLQARLADAGGGAFDEDFAKAILPQTNTLRDAGGLAPYEWDDGLALCARAHAADMASRGYFGHASPEGFMHLDRVALLMRDLCGKTAENLAWRDYPSGSTPQDMEALWEGSPGHRRNLLREGYARAGYGVVKAGSAYYAAGVYADANIRLGQALPLWATEDAELKGVFAGASPIIEKLALTAPFQPPTWMAAASGHIPSLQQGAWQLRPLQASGEGRFNVISGPVFFVS